MIGKKINELATELAPLSTDLTIIGDPTTGVSKKITLEQISSLFGGSVSFYANLAGFPAVGNIDIIYCAKDTKKLYLWSGSAYVEMFPSQALLDTYQLRSEKGNANGYASLDSLGKVPISQLPSSLMEYKGMWNAATNTPTLANGTGDTGDVYICNVAGTVNFGAGPLTFAVGDYVIYSGSIWQRSSGAVGTVTSVAATITGDSLTISGSPVTTSGTLAFAFNGTTAQYIRGNGTLATFPSLTGFVPYTGATTNVNLGTHSLSAYDLIINHTSGSGVAAQITKGGNGEALTVVKSSGSGNAASITGGVTLLDELHLNTDLADAYIASATNWNAAYNDKINSAAVTGTTTKTLTLTQQDGGTITASWTDDNTDAVTSVFGRTGAVVAVSGDYTTAQVTESGNLYFTNARAIASTLTGYTSGAGTITSSDSILSAIQKLNGNIGALTTGVSSVNGLTGAVTLTTSNIAEGTNLYYTEARVNANTNVAANTAARHNAVTIGTANGLSLSTQVLSLGLASTSTTGALSSTDWNTFNNKTSNTGTVTSVGLSSATSGVTIGSTPITTSGTITLAIATASGSQQGLLSSTDWTTFNNKQSALTNPVTGTGTTNYLPKFTGASTIGDSIVQDSGSLVTIGGSLTVTGNVTIRPTSGYNAYFQTSGTALRINYLNDALSANVSATYRATDFGWQKGDGTEVLKLDASGNLGLGVTPSAWSGGFAVAEYKGGFIGSQSSSYLYQGQNGYFNGTNWVYTTNGSATKIEQSFGAYRWYQAPSGTAGNAISFTQAMTLDASGNLMVAATSPSNTASGRGNITIGGSSTSILNFQIGGTVAGYLYHDNNNLNILNSNASGALLLSTNSTTRLTIASTGAATFSSSVTATQFIVGSATTSSDVSVRYKTDTGDFSTINDRGTHAFGIYDHQVSLYRMYINTSGNVGIGTTSPSGQLHLKGASGLTNFGTQVLQVESSTDNFSGIVFSGTNGSNAAIRSEGASTMTFWTASGTSYNERMRITSGGNVNILSNSTNSTFTGGGPLAIKNSGSDPYLSWHSNDGTRIGYLQMQGSNIATLAVEANQALAFQTNGTERMRITSGGNVEINTGSIKTGEPDTGWGRAAIKIGASVSGAAFDVTRYLPVSVDGTVYYINLNSSTP